jgi:sterol desaturase/sphingolipid hydroxylase (fatty acid hydroxylase superfamily)
MDFASDLDPALLNLVLPVLAGCALLEMAVLRITGRGSYHWPETLATLAIAIGQRLSGMLAAAFVMPVYWAVWAWSPWHIALDNPLAWTALFLGVEWCYYWQHRAGHEVRWFWASHCVHHSVRHFNLSAAYRLGWTAGVSGLAFFYLPLALAGFHPGAIFGILALNLLWQFWLHTELVPRLGPLEWVLNTPSHHRVHHATNLRCLDRNYGGVLIVFDRLLGTFAAEPANERLRYGLVSPIDSHNPLVIVFHEWRAMLHDVAHAHHWKTRLRFLIRPPGWRPDGQGMTTADLRRRWLVHRLIEKHRPPSITKVSHTSATLHRS